jgi:hypothetical protein
MCVCVLHPQVWDLGSERLMQQVSVRSSPGPSGGPVALDRLSAGQSDPRLLLAGCSDGLLRLFDLRASLTPVASLATGEGGWALGDHSLLGWGVEVVRLDAPTRVEPYSSGLTSNVWLVGTAVLGCAARMDCKVVL